MVKYFKKELILSSLLILLPCAVGLLLWNRLPDSMVTHWGANGQPDGITAKAVTVFFLPLFLLVMHWVCLLITGKDPKNKNRNHKVFRLVMWIMPLVSIYSSAIIYTTAFGYAPNMSMMSIAPIGVLFVIVGNYLPKCQQNHTIGIKIPWTLANEENWNLTHRFGGKCWVVGGLAMILCVFLPESLAIWIMLAAILVLALLPMLYSWRIYRRHKQQGIEYPKVSAFYSKKAGRISTIFLILFLVFIGWIMFTGDITFSLGEDALTVEADFYTDLTIPYDTIDSIEFRDGNIPGIRFSGFNSARLLMGHFQNEEFGSYTRYTYTTPDGCIVIRSGTKVLVLSTEQYSQTLKLYLQLMEKIPLS